MIYGFPGQIQALQFEWAWQHPEKSLDMREAAARLGRKARYGVAGKIALLMEMLHTDPWCYFPLTIQFLSSEMALEKGKCQDPPGHVQVLVAPLESILSPSFERNEEDERQEEENILPTISEQPSLSVPITDLTEPKKKGKKSQSACALCETPATRTWISCECGKRCHVGCLARHYIASDSTAINLPKEGTCPNCGLRSSWMSALQRTRNAGWGQHKRARDAAQEATSTQNLQAVSVQVLQEEISSSFKEVECSRQPAHRSIGCEAEETAEEREEDIETVDVLESDSSLETYRSPSPLPLMERYALARSTQKGSKPEEIEIISLLNEDDD